MHNRKSEIPENDGTREGDGAVVVQALIKWSADSWEGKKSFHFHVDDCLFPFFDLKSAFFNTFHLSQKFHTFFQWEQKPRILFGGLTRFLYNLFFYQKAAWV